MKYSTHPTNPPNLCLECGEVCRRPKRFCNDAERELFGRGTSINQRGAAQVKEQRRMLGITPEALEFRRKRNVQQPL